MKLTSVPFSFRAVILLISNVPRTSCFYILFKVTQGSDQVKMTNNQTGLWARQKTAYPQEICRMREIEILW